MVKQEAQLEREKELESRFMTEGQKIHYMIKVEKRNKEDEQSTLRHKKRELEIAEGKHRIKKKMWRQRIKHLLYENQNEITILKTENETSSKRANDGFVEQNRELKMDKRSLHIEQKEMELSHLDAMKALLQDHDKKIATLRQEYERKSKDVQYKFEVRMKEVRDVMTQRRKSEIKAIEKMKDAHINELMKQHKEAFNEIKNYYSDITHNNLDLIKSLKEEVSVMGVLSFTSFPFCYRRWKQISHSFMISPLCPRSLTGECPQS